MVQDSNTTGLELPPIIPPRIPEDQDPFEKTVWEISNFETMALTFAEYRVLEDHHRRPGSMDQGFSRNHCSVSSGSCGR